MRLFSIRLGNGLLAIAAVFLFATSVHAAPGDFVAAQGVITPKGGIVHVAAPAGRTGQAIVAELKVKEGDKVEAGQILATLTGRAAAEADLEAAKLEAAAAAKAPAIIQAQIDALTSQIAAAQADVTTAERQVAASGAASDQAKAGVETAKKARREAMETLDASLAKITGTNAAYQNTLDELDPPRRETEEIKFQQKLLNEEYRAADAPRYAQGARMDAEIAAAESAVKAADLQKEVATAQVAAAKSQVATVEAQRAVLKAELARAEAVAKAAQGGIAQATAALAFFEVKAPSAGTILNIGANPGEAVGPAGLVTMGDLSKRFVDAEVYIDDARKIKVGQSATIKSDAFIGEMSGKVSEVGQLVNPQGLFSSDPLAYTDKRVIVVRIALDPAQGWQPPVNTLVISRINVQGSN